MENPEIHNQPEPTTKLEHSLLEQQVKRGGIADNSILEASLDAIVGFDENGTIDIFSRAAEKVFGYTKEEIIGKNIETLLPFTGEVTSVKLFPANVKINLKSLVGQGKEMYGKRKDGSIFPMDASVGANADPGKVYYAGIFRDITKQKQLMADLKKAKETAEEASSYKSTFLANMSHEIRTPMNGILGMAELLGNTQLNSEQQDYVETIKYSTDALLKILNDVIDLAKIEAGRLELELTEFNLPEVVDNSIRLFAIAAEEKNVELLQEIDVRLPSWMVGDSLRIRQVLINLLGNALKFTSQGEIVLMVKRTKQEEGKFWVRFSVSDTGPGIPESKQKEIFDAFSQADPSITRRFGGTGLGLAISSQLVKMMHGQIWVESKAGEGSVFNFELPFDMAKEKKPVVMPSILSRLQGIKVLIVDDNFTNRKILKGNLRHWGMQTQEVSNGIQALEALKQARQNSEPFKLLLIDAHMPLMDGFTLAKKIKEEAAMPEITLMMLASSDQRSEPGFLRNLNIQSFLLKPIKQSQLLSAITECLFFNTQVNEKVALVDKISEVANSPASSAKLKVLLAEDNKVNQRVAQNMLEKAGFEVSIANNGREALEMYQENQFDLILMDVQMPEISGLEATQSIRKTESGSQQHIPIIAVTAHAMKQDRDRCLEAGMDDYIAKPIKMEVLKKTIRHFYP